MHWADGNIGTSIGTHDTDDIPSGPNEQLGFEVDSTTDDDHFDSFAPEYYPDRFTQGKGRELDRYGQQCGGESVSIKTIKNREFHIEGIVLQKRVMTFQSLLDYKQPVNLLSPLTPRGGMECHIKDGELKEQEGWDPHTRQWQFGYSLDLVSTGRDEHADESNAIVSAVIQ